MLKLSEAVYGNKNDDDDSLLGNNSSLSSFEISTSKIDMGNPIVYTPINAVKSKQH